MSVMSKLHGKANTFSSQNVTYRCYMTSRRYVTLSGAQPVYMLRVAKHESGVERVYECKVMVKVGLRAAIESLEANKKGST